MQLQSNSADSSKSHSYTLWHDAITPAEQHAMMGSVSSAS
jgi:hypothetical protein